MNVTYTSGITMRKKNKQIWNTWLQLTLLRRKREKRKALPRDCLSPSSQHARPKQSSEISKGSKEASQMA